jgi:cold shock CspA family protein
MSFENINNITFGFSDAENYRRRENKELFNRIFLRTDALEKIKRPNTYFLVGEKGTGKTAYAVYMSNSPTEDTHSSHKFIRETDYLKFIHLKNKFNLSLSEYTDIWKVIILLISCHEIYTKLGGLQKFVQYSKFREINDAIDAYYNQAFSPEILSALQFVENSEMAAEIVSKISPTEAKIRGEESIQTTTNLQVFQTSLLYLEKRMKDALSSVKLPKDFYIFVDGIDIRPNTVPYGEYLECVKGLANAIWSLNNDFFSNIKDSKGRIKTILLLRPDIFNSLGLQNRNTKLKDNSIVLNWITDYKKHRSSQLFNLADRIFSSQQQQEHHTGDCWDHYFPFEATNLEHANDGITSFVIFLRYSYHRPRDILTMLDLLGESYKSDAKRSGVFRLDDLFTSNFKETYGNYLLGEIRDSLSFYYDESEFELFLKFFEFLSGNKKFTYEQYLSAFTDFQSYIDSQSNSPPDFMKTPEEFLQFLYDQNVLCFVEETIDETFIRWCFRERNANNISPKVKYGMSYEIHYGLANTLNTGKPFSKKSVIVSKSRSIKDDDKTKKQLFGVVKFFNKEKRFGFIKNEQLPVDIYFQKRDILDDATLRSSDEVYFYIEADPKKQGQMIARQVRKVKKKHFR